MNRRQNNSWASLSVADLIGSVRRHLISVILVATVVTAAVVAMLLAWPNQYRSDGLMYVRLGRMALNVDPTANPSAGVSLQESRTSEVVSIAEMLGSREIAERIVQQLGADTLLQPRTWIDRSIARLRGAMPSKGGGTWGDMTAEQCQAQVDLENAVRKVHESLQISMPRDAYTVSVGAKFSDPIVAQQIAQAAMDQYALYHVEAHRATGSFEFFEQQVQNSREKAAKAQQNLQSAKNELGWLNPDTAEKTLSERFVNVEVAMDETSGQLAEAERTVIELAKQLDTVDQWIPVEKTSGVASKSADDMRTQLYDLQVQQNDELAKIMPSHPRYRMLKEKMEANSKIVDGEEKGREVSREAINPVFQDLQTAHSAAIAKAAGLKAKHAALESELTQIREDVERLNRDSARLNELAWEAKIAERDYLEHTRRYDEARITHDLDRENLSDVSIVQDASLNLKKSSPSRALLAIVGAFLGLSLGLLQAFLRDTGDATGRSVDREFAGPESRIDPIHGDVAAPSWTKGANQIDAEHVAQSRDLVTSGASNTNSHSATESNLPR
ncbi:GumC family protein [Crateriforma conspicua]|uniref:GumC family protein n=1 Tax=Crateriforma TaxID=2714592 RepID=UPI0018CCF057|nr:hypothetical protein [Crateriforma conspicua]